MFCYYLAMKARTKYNAIDKREWDRLNFGAGSPSFKNGLGVVVFEGVGSISDQRVTYTTITIRRVRLGSEVR